MLDESVYHTAIPSCRGTSGDVLALVKDATTGALSDGRLIAWVYSDTAALWYPVFRNQVADGGSDEQDEYYMYLFATEIWFSYVSGGSGANIQKKDISWSWSAETWYKLRITWWHSVDSIYVRMERWTGSAWVTLGDEADTDFIDGNDRWKDNAVNRCGMNVGTTRWMDDVEVWG